MVFHSISLFGQSAVARFVIIGTADYPFNKTISMVFPSVSLGAGSDPQARLLHDQHL